MSELEPMVRHSLETYRSAQDFIERYNQEYRRALDTKDDSGLVALSDTHAATIKNYNYLIDADGEGYLSINNGARESFEYSYTDYVTARGFITDYNKQLSDVHKLMNMGYVGAGLEKQRQLRQELKDFEPKVLIAKDATTGVLALNPDIEADPPKPASLSEQELRERMSVIGYENWEIDEEIASRVVDQKTLEAMGVLSGKSPVEIDPSRKKVIPIKKEAVMTAEFAEEAEALAKEKAQAPETPKPEWVSLVIKGNFLSDAHQNPATGKEFYNVSIPKGTKLGGAIDVGGYSFTANASQVHPYKFDDNAVQINFPQEWTISLEKREQQPDGGYATVDKKQATPGQMKVALNKQYKQFKQTLKAKREQKQAQQKASPVKDQAKAEVSAEARSKSTKQQDRKISK